MRDSDRLGSIEDRLIVLALGLPRLDWYQVEREGSAVLGRERVQAFRQDITRRTAKYQGERLAQQALRLAIPDRCGVDPRQGQCVTPALDAKNAVQIGDEMRCRKLLAHQSRSGYSSQLNGAL